MRRRRFIDPKEIEIRVRRARGHEHRATPWRKLAGERVGRVQRASTRRGSAGIGSRSKLHTRGSVVKASYSRNDRSGRWTAHARYLTREGAERQQAHGIGFDSAGDGLDVVTTVHGWEKRRDYVAPDRLTRRRSATRSRNARTRSRGVDGTRSRNASRVDRNRSQQHR
jgi:hypothetical protein